MLKASPAPSAVEKSFCTTREAASLLGVSVGTVQLWVESGLLEAWKTSGGHRRVVRASIDRLLHKPGQQPADRPAGEATSVPTAPRKLRILVVEDDPGLLRLYQAVIGQWPLPCSLSCISNAVEALLAIGREAPDLLVTDLHMPEVDGFEMLRVLERAEGFSALRVVVVSGLDATAIAARGGLPAGIEILPKPVPFQRLQDIAAGVLAAVQNR